LKYREVTAMKKYQEETEGEQKNKEYWAEINKSMKQIEGGNYSVFTLEELEAFAKGSYTGEQFRALGKVKKYEYGVFR
jgi:L-rhamnose mutarotase